MLLQVYLTWIPLAYIFNTNLLEILLSLFPKPAFRNLALQCLTEVGSLPEVGPEHNEMFVLLFQHFMGSLTQVLPDHVDIAQVCHFALIAAPDFLSHHFTSMSCKLAHRLLLSSACMTSMCMFTRETRCKQHLFGHVWRAICICDNLCASTESVRIN